MAKRRRCGRSGGRASRSRGSRLLEGDYAGAEPELQESLRLFQQRDDDSGEAHALQTLGVLAMATGDFARRSSGSGRVSALARSEQPADDRHRPRQSRRSAPPQRRSRRGRIPLPGSAGPVRVDRRPGRPGLRVQPARAARARSRQCRGRPERLSRALRLRWSAGERAPPRTRSRPSPKRPGGSATRSSPQRCCGRRLPCATKPELRVRRFTQSDIRRCCNIADSGQPTEAPDIDIVVASVLKSGLAAVKRF